MTAKHVTVEGLAEALNTSAWQYHSGAEPLARSLFAALPDDCPAEAVREWANDQIDVQHELERRHNEQVDRADAAEADAAALAEALREVVDVHSTVLLRTTHPHCCQYVDEHGEDCPVGTALAAHDRRVKGGE